jgi:hypothetical protein
LRIDAVERNPTGEEPTGAVEGEQRIARLRLTAV